MPRLTITTDDGTVVLRKDGEDLDELDLKNAWSASMLLNQIQHALREARRLEKENK